MKIPLIILSKKNYQRRLQVLNEELLIILNEEGKALMLLREEVKGIDPDSFTADLFLEYAARRKEVKKIADAKRKSAHRWFTWYPVICNFLWIALIIALVKFFILPFIN